MNTEYIQLKSRKLFSTKHLVCVGCIGILLSSTKIKIIIFKLRAINKYLQNISLRLLNGAKEASCSIPLAQMWSDVRAAYTNFFKSCKGVRKGKFSKPPRFKSKKNLKDSFRYSCSNCTPKIGKEGLYLTRKLGWISG